LNSYYLQNTEKRFDFSNLFFYTNKKTDFSIRLFKDYFANPGYTHARAEASLTTACNASNASAGSLSIPAF